MKKVVLHPALRDFRGTMGGMVFRNQNGKLIVSMKPMKRETEPTEGQATHRARFKKAVAYGKSVMADSETHELYKQVAELKETPTFALIVADYLNAPTIDDLDVSAYAGQVDDIIKITASDDFGVAKVHISITDEQGMMIENGYAMETAEGLGLWVYVATTSVESNVIITAVATDRPGGTAVKTVNKNF